MEVLRATTTIPDPNAPHVTADSLMGVVPQRSPIITTSLRPASLVHYLIGTYLGPTLLKYPTL